MMINNYKLTSHFANFNKFDGKTLPSESDEVQKIFNLNY